MEISETKREKLRRNAEILQLKTELLIESCTGWLSAEEGNKNMEKRILERKKQTTSFFSGAGNTDII